MWRNNDAVSQNLIPLPFFITGVDAHIAVRDSLTSKYEREQVISLISTHWTCFTEGCMISQFLACFREGLVDSKVQVMAAQMATYETAADEQAAAGLAMFMSLLWISYPKAGNISLISINIQQE
jgi:hypothetical protein